MEKKKRKGIRKKLAQFLSVVLMLSLLMTPSMASLAATAQGWVDDIVDEDIIDEDAFWEYDEDEEDAATDSNAEKATDSNADTATNSNAENIGPGQMEVPMLYSLRPLPEVYAYLLLNEYSEEELKTMPVDTMLSLLRDGEGNPVEIADDAEIVWGLFKDVDGDVLDDEYHVIGRGDTVDLYQDENYTMDFIVGSGNQLDSGNVRYVVTVYVSTIFEENLVCRLYTERYRNHVTQHSRIFFPSLVLNDMEIPLCQMTYTYSYHESGDKYHFGINSDIASDTNTHGIQVDVYPMAEFLEYWEDGLPLDGAITDQILNQNQIHQEGGYEGYEEECFFVVYTDAHGEMVGCLCILFVVLSEKEEITGQLYAYENGKMIDITVKDNDLSLSDYYISCELDVVSTKNGIHLNNDGMNYVFASPDIKVGYSADEDYYYALDDNDQIEKIVLGQFGTLEEANAVNAEDITKKVLPTDREQAPYGYRVNFGNNRTYVYFTVFLVDGSSFICRVRPDFSEERNTDELDFYVYGANGYEEYYEIYKPHWHDTLDDYDYQTLFILDKDIDLKTLKPEFRCGHSGIKVYAGGTEQISGVSEQDFSEGSVFYAVYFGDNLRNYNVTFVKQESGPKLFVNGPDEREIFLTEVYDNRHDILIANVGDEELTGLKVELLNAVNVKLDDYWVVGGEGNDTLDAFSTVDISGYYNQLPNLAKIRLLPDGVGEVSGTLKVSADGQEDVLVTLKGYAGNPRIITENLGEATKYVPYSFLVATDNMHRDNKTTFSITSGKLPNGLELYPATGEIYGVPLETGEFPITVKASYSQAEFVSSSKKLVLTVQDNTNTNVYDASDTGYELTTHIGREVGAGTRDYVLTSFRDQLFVSAGEYDEFVDLWLNGERLTDGEDYTKESGSTRITVRSQTFQTKAQEGYNTIAAEFRVDGDSSNELKRTAQNFRIGGSVPDSGGDSGNDSGSNLGDASGNDSSSDSDSSSSSQTETATDIANKTNQPAASFTDDSWMQDDIGWRCKAPDGSWLANTWHQLPYRGTMEWYFFDAQGYMLTGWFFHDNRWYYLSPFKDGTQGKMFTGWHYIDRKWYYFNEVSDGLKGALVTDTWVGDYYVNGNGVWTE